MSRHLSWSEVEGIATRLTDSYRPFVNGERISTPSSVSSSHSLLWCSKSNGIQWTLPWGISWLLNTSIPVSIFLNLTWFIWAKYSRYLCQFPGPAGGRGSLDNHIQRSRPISQRKARIGSAFRWWMVPSSYGAIPGQWAIYPRSCGCVTQDFAVGTGKTCSRRSFEACTGPDVFSNSLWHDLHSQGRFSYDYVWTILILTLYRPLH